MLRTICPLLLAAVATAFPTTLLADQPAATADLPPALSQLSIDQTAIMSTQRAAYVRGEGFKKKFKTEFKVFIHGYLLGKGEPLAVDGIAGGQKVSIVATPGELQIATQGAGVVGPHPRTHGLIFANTGAFYGVVGVKGNLKGAHVVLLPKAFAVDFH